MATVAPQNGSAIFEVLHPRQASVNPLLLQAALKQLSSQKNPTRFTIPKISLNPAHPVNSAKIPVQTNNPQSHTKAHLSASFLACNRKVRSE